MKTQEHQNHLLQPQNQIEYIYFAEDVVAPNNGANGEEVRMVFTRKYYDAYDTFYIENSKQMCFVLDGPVRKADDYWEYTVRLMDSNISAQLDLEACKTGMPTRWVGNVQPEFQAQGYVKYQQNAQLCRSWISEIRCDVEASSRYLALEDNFVEVAQEKDRDRKTVFFKLPGMKKLLLENFMLARNNSLLLQHGTMDINGKSTLSDRQGREIIAGDGALVQINRYATKYCFAEITPNLLNEMIVTLAQKCPDVTGNNFMFILNTRAYHKMQTVLSEFLANHHTDGGHVWSKKDGKVKVGATYDTYEFAGNTLMVKVDRCLDFEYPTKSYGVMIDLTGDAASGHPAVEMFTIEGKQFIENTMKGAGIESGDVATAVAGIRHMVSGYQGIAVYNPYRSVIMIEA